MPTRAEVLHDGTISGEESLGLTRGRKQMHVSLALTGGLVRILCAVVEIAVLTMFYSRQNLALSSTVALQLIGDEHPWPILAPFKDLWVE